MNTHAHTAGAAPDLLAAFVRSRGEMPTALKAAPPPGDSSLEFVMSDDSVDRMGDVIEPRGWQLANFQANPVALWQHKADQVIGLWRDVRVVKNRLLGRLDLAARHADTPVVNAVRALVEQNILRAVSVGFKPIEMEALDDSADDFWGPFRFLKQELLECSLVAVPANANALATAKSMALPRELQVEIFGKPAREDRPIVVRAPTGKPAKPLARQGAIMTRSQRIEAAQQSIVEMTDRLETLDTQETRTDAEETDYLALPDKITETRAALEQMENIERAVGQALTAKTGQRLPTTNRITVAAPRGKIFDKPQDALYKTMTALFIAKGTNRPFDEVLRARYNDENVAMVIRAAVAPAQTTVTAWAGALVGTAIAEFLSQLPRSAIYPVLSRLGSKFTFGANGIIKVPSRLATPKINGSFVGEGNPIPVRKAALTSIPLTAKKMGVISTFTKEMAEHSTPSIESVIRQAMNEDTAESIDQVLIDNVVDDAIRPAGLLWGSGAPLVGLTPAATGTQFEKMVADINTLAAPITANRGGANLVLLMNPAQKRKMSWAVAPNGTFVFSSVDNGQVRDLTVVASTTVPAGRIIMLDADEFATATGDNPEFDVSDVATIHEEDTAPLAIVGGTVQPPILASIAAPVRSLWQTASIGVRMILPMNWTMRRAGMVSFMDAVTW